MSVGTDYITCPSCGDDVHIEDYDINSDKCKSCSMYDANQLWHEPNHEDQ